MRDVATQAWDEDDGLFVAIGAFLDSHGLAPDPVHYSFAHAALTDPELNAAVAQLTDGGVRLSRAEIERLGGTVRAGATRSARCRARKEDHRAAALVAETQAQVDGFADLVRSVRQETSGFGRDLAASAAALQQQATLAGLTEIARITGSMATRIRDAERRLASATAEADTLRTRLTEAQGEARRDALTGLPNRLAFEEAFAAAALTPAPVCLAVCDIDHFKGFNDCHGHGVGDRVLSAIGRGLVDACDGQFVARHGGEEFAVLLTDVPLVAAATLLDRAREGLGERRFRDRETGAVLGRITLSAGVIAVRPEEPLAAALERADRLLYAAKADGRDRVCAG